MDSSELKGYRGEIRRDKGVSSEEELRYERIILYPLVTEKTMQMIEKENKLVFIVDRKANKKLVKKAVENLYNVKVERVNIMIGSRGKKKAFVKLTPQYSATELSMKLKIL